MFKRRLREPFGKAGLIVAAIALVFAMLGGAYAASHAQDKKNVVKRGSRGPKGATGATGPAGANGVNGTKGANGTNGANGKSVTVSAASCGGLGGALVKQEGAPSGVEVCNGEDGVLGESPAGAAFSGEEEPAGEPCNGAGGVDYLIEATGDEQIVCNGGGGGGGGGGFNYTFSAGTDPAVDPGSGELALNKAAAGEATTLSISNTDSDANPIASVLAGWISSAGAKGTLLIRKSGDPNTFAEYTITGANKSEGEFRNVTITPITASGTFAAGDTVSVVYWASASKTLPIGAEEVGTWAFSGTQAENGTANPSREGPLAVISFPIPVKAIPRERIFFQGEPGFSEHCGGRAGAPSVSSAEYGEELLTTLCIFTDESGSLHNAELIHIWSPSFSSEEEFSRNGGVLQFHIPNPGLGFGIGGWAVQVH